MSDAFKSSHSLTRPGKDGKRRKRVRVASLASMQKRIKKQLGIQNHFEGDSYVALGRISREARNSVTDRLVKFYTSAEDANTAKAPTRLTGHRMQTVIMSLVPEELHEEVLEYINRVTDATLKPVNAQ